MRRSHGKSPQSRRSLRALERSWIALLPSPAIEPGLIKATEAKPRRKLKLSPARRRAVQLHGRYIGYGRQLKPKAKVQVRRTRAEKGVRAAIARGRKLATQ